jgi:hypothetical protein
MFLYSLSPPRVRYQSASVLVAEPCIVRYNLCLQLFVLSFSEEFSVIIASDINGSAKFEPRRKLSPETNIKTSAWNERKSGEL